MFVLCLSAAAPFEMHQMIIFDVLQNDQGVLGLVTPPVFPFIDCLNSGTKAVDPLLGKIIVLIPHFVGVSG